MAAGEPELALKAYYRAAAEQGIDADVLSAIGSANLDNRSFRLNFEVMLLTVDSDFAASVENMLKEDFEQAYEVAKEESREIHRLQQVGMRIARLISPIL